MPTTWRFSTSDEILFGRGAAAQIGAEAALRGYARALIITDARLIDAGLAAPLQQSLQAVGVRVDVFAGGAPEPSDVIVDAAAALARETMPDVLVALGGGSNMDVAKVAAAVYTHGGVCADYFGEDKIPGPTGTGSEVTAVAVIEHVARGLKLGVASTHVRPKLAIVDPLLTRSCPPRVTAESGMDALVHAVEALTVVTPGALVLPEGLRPQFTGRSPLTDSLAERAIGLVGEHLRRAVYTPADMDAREGMHLAALLAGMAFSSAGLGAVHALQYPVGAVTHTSHGLGTGLLLPYVVEYLLPANPRGFARVAELLGAPAQAERCVEAIQQLKKDIGIPLRLREIGVEEMHLRPMAEQAATYARLLRMSVRPMNADALLEILKRAW
ncbi:MAG: iron-containing alcohol dehydrogenase [Chloroflexi bacterium]|nr:iron-containing alcohol dehydrogenase [Chloroflexota bacterium]